MAQELADWSELQYDLLVLIARHLNLIEDYLNFGTVCKSWHSVPTKNNFNNYLSRAPWLMIAEEDGNSIRKFFSLYNGMILNKRIPKARRKRCMESMGWLIMVGEDEGEISMLHPFSGVQIELPHQNTTIDYHNHRTGWKMGFIFKAVLSANPSHTFDYLLMVIEGNTRFLSFWRPGDIRWTRVTLQATNRMRTAFFDLIYFNGQIYAVDYSGDLLVCDIADVVSPQPTKYHIVAQIPLQPQDRREQLYIVESLGSLFVILRYGVQLRLPKDDCDRIPLTFIPIADERGVQDVEYTYGTRNFRVFQVDLAVGKMAETRELGDMAFFLGANTSLSVQASQFPGIKPNHIYFTDDYFVTYLAYEEGGGLDMGVFKLADGSIQPHYNGVSLSRFCPPTWVTPTLY
ncbi:probable F-box protein At1g65740 [Solanum stenotomum]|uniref:probable F-box protein At1g65740 n=1 Tax=Solanum stenotomum TaxID=172797 RepID=UPI0020D16883|nr:probable F-box protein At1g65740 [Solanum stenotomum]